MTEYTTKQGDMLDEICLEKFGVVEGYLEKILDLNEGLCLLLDADYIFQEGITIILPEKESKDQSKDINRIFS